MLLKIQIVKELNLYHKYFRPPYTAECLFRLTMGSATNGHEPFTSSASQLHLFFLRFHQLFVRLCPIQNFRLHILFFFFFFCT
jgi:hypothetical protein